MQKVYPLHPYADLFPEMSKAEYIELREDIRKNGMREALTLANNEFLIDGRHRLKACIELGIPPKYRGITGNDEQLLAYVISTNLRRRHLSREQREIIAAQIANLKNGTNRHTVLASSGELARTQKQAAEAMDVSVSGVKRAKAVVEHGAPELIEAVKQGKLETSVAAEIAKMPLPAQQEVIARGAKEIHAKSKELREQSKAAAKEKRRNELAIKAETFFLDPVATTPDDIRIICADGRDLLEHVEPESVDLIVTSPPYNVGMAYDNYSDDLPSEKYRDLLGSIFSRCHVALKDGGRIAVVVPLGVERSPYKLFAPFVHNILDECGFISRGWIVWDKNNVQNRTSWGSHRSFTSPALRDRVEIIMVAHKGSDTLAAPEGTLGKDANGTFSEFLRDPNYFNELTQNYWNIQPETRFSKEHPAPFPELLAQRLIHLYAFPGALIVDPCAGTGTVAVVAKQNKCRAVVVDQSPLYCALMKERLEETA